MHVAEFYIERQAYISALNRARFVVENYQGTPSVPRALEIMIEMYLRSGLNDLADTSLDILRQNYPDSPALDEEGNFIIATQITDPSFLYSMTFGLVGSNKRDTPIAPQRRPTRTADQEGIIIPDTGRPRSLLNMITLGLLGDPGSEGTPVPEESQ